MRRKITSNSRCMRRSSSKRPRRRRSTPPRLAGDDLTAQLQQLSQLHNAGVLSDAEFAAAKQKLLAS